MKLGSPKPQIFINLDVRNKYFNWQCKKEDKTKGVRKKVQMVPISLRRSLDFFQLCGYA